MLSLAGAATGAACLCTVQAAAPIDLQHLEHSLFVHNLLAFNPQDSHGAAMFPERARPGTFFLFEQLSHGPFGAVNLRVKHLNGWSIQPTPASRLVIASNFA